MRRLLVLLLGSSLTVALGSAWRHDPGGAASGARCTVPNRALRGELIPTRRVEVPEPGIAMSIPEDWEAHIILEPRDAPALPDSADVHTWRALAVGEP